VRRKAERKSKIFRATILMWALLSAATGLLWSPSLCPQAQQQDRQLVQTGGEGGQRLALVIGNGAYKNAPPLKNPPNDARDMADALSRLGFTVEHGVDLDQKLMKQMIRQFGQKLKSGGRGVFYYAGHGVQSKGRNYLIPVDAVIESEADIEDQGVDVQLMLNYMDDAQNGLNILILDACRNNPFGRSMRSAENGLAQVDAPTGTLIAYATAPGRVASDNPGGKNGLYTSELLKQMRVPGLSVTDMFMRVRAEVVKQTSGKQVPWEASSLIGSFAFNAAAGANSSAASRPSAALKDAAAVEAEYWETIKNSTNAADYQEYLKEYPQGRYVQLARLKLRQLEAAKSRRNDSSVGATTTPSESKASVPSTDLTKDVGAQPKSNNPVTSPKTSSEISSGGGFVLSRSLPIITGNETTFRQAMEKYQFKRDVTIQTLNMSGQVTGQYHRLSQFVFDDQGKVYEKIILFPMPTIQEITITAEDLESFDVPQLFALEASKADKYNFTYVGKERVDDLETQVFDVMPKLLPDPKKSKERFFQGRVWVDDRDMAVVKLRGKQVTASTNQQFPTIEVYREQIDGQNWFPTYIWSDEQITFNNGQTVRVKILVRLAEFVRRK
jgi:uncharacterized caspase-like protein